MNQFSFNLLRTFKLFVSLSGALIIVLCGLLVSLLVFVTIRALLESSNSFGEILVGMVQIVAFLFLGSLFGFLLSLIIYPFNLVWLLFMGLYLIKNTQPIFYKIKHMEFLGINFLLILIFDGYLLYTTCLMPGKMCVGEPINGFASIVAAFMIHIFWVGIAYFLLESVALIFQKYCGQSTKKKQSRSVSIF